MRAHERDTAALLLLLLREDEEAMQDALLGTARCHVAVCEKARAGTQYVTNFQYCTVWSASACAGLKLEEEVSQHEPHQYIKRVCQHRKKKKARCESHREKTSGVAPVSPRTGETAHPIRVLSSATVWSVEREDRVCTELTELSHWPALALLD